MCKGEGGQLDVCGICGVSVCHVHVCGGISVYVFVCVCVCECALLDACLYIESQNSPVKSRQDRMFIFL